MGFADSFFARRYGVTERDLDGFLSEALSRGGDYADLYFEYLATSQISLDESIIKGATEGVSLGVGVRVVSGERTGYAYTGDLTPGKIREAARVAACIADAPAKVEKIGLGRVHAHRLYEVPVAPTETSFRERAALVRRAGQAARAYPGFPHSEEAELALFPDCRSRSGWKGRETTRQSGNPFSRV